MAEEDRKFNQGQQQQFQHRPQGQGFIPRGRGRGRGRGGTRGGRDGPPQRTQEERLMERFNMISGPSYELPNRDHTEIKFNNRARLYIGNIANDLSEDEVSEMFKQFGETHELFINREKNFGFIKLDFRVNADKARSELDGQMKKGRALKVRSAPHQAAVKVRNLNLWVTNELLEMAFAVFGEVERAIVIVDERGKSTGRGIVEFARKPSARFAIECCQEKCLFLTSSLRPVIVEPLEEKDDEEGFQEKNLPKKHPEYLKERETGPRLAQPGSFEHEYGQRWKQLYEMHKQKKEALDQELKMEEEKLEAQMQFARYEHETEMLREQLRQRELDRERQKREWELKEQEHDEQRRRQEEMYARRQGDMQARMREQEEEIRRRQQENSLFMQANQLHDMLDAQERQLRDVNPGGGNTMPQQEPKPFMESYDNQMSGRYDNMQSEMRGNVGNQWGRDRDDFGGPGGKRRRY